MSKWTQETALDELRQFIDQIERLRDGDHTSSGHTRWFLGVTNFLKEVFGQDSVYYTNLVQLPWEYHGFMKAHPSEWFNPGATQARYNRPAYAQALNAAQGILLAAHDELQQSDIETVYHGKDTPAEASTIVAILNLVDHKLRKTIRDRPNKERTVQDAIENMFIAADVPYSRESESIEYSSKTYRPDFTVKKADLAIEVKLCAKPEREKEMIAEINDDIVAYSTKYGNLLFVVYDCGIVRDIERFTRHFEEASSVVVESSNTKMLASNLHTD
jgi:hypothetical protein